MKYTNENIKAKKINMIKKRKCLNLFACIVIVPLIIFNLILIYFSITNQDTKANLFGLHLYVIVSGSMEPTINIGDVLIVKQVEENQINKGDIISFNENGAIVSHRVVDINFENGKNYYITKGDNNNSNDIEPISYENIEGKVYYTIPYLGKLLLFFKNKIVILFILLIFFVFCLFDIHMNDKEEQRKKKRMRYEVQQ